MTPDDMIAVIQARKEGKQVEQSPLHGGITPFGERVWDPMAHRFDFQNYTYRVKPERLEAWVCMYRNRFRSYHPSREEAEARAVEQPINFLRIVHMREVDE